MTRYYAYSIPGENGKKCGKLSKISIRIFDISGPSNCQQHIRTWESIRYTVIMLFRNGSDWVFLFLIHSLSLLLHDSRVAGRGPITECWLGRIGFVRPAFPIHSREWNGEHGTNDGSRRSPLRLCLRAHKNSPDSSDWATTPIDVPVVAPVGIWSPHFKHHGEEEELVRYVDASVNLPLLFALACSSASSFVLFYQFLCVFQLLNAVVS